MTLGILSYKKKKSAYLCVSVVVYVRMPSLSVFCTSVRTNYVKYKSDVTTFCDFGLQ